MARLRISEYRAKKLLLGGDYAGMSIAPGSETVLPHTGSFVVKVDQGIKKRLQLGLLALDVPAKKILRAVNGWRERGFSRFIAEPILLHEANEERYLSLERVRSGMRLLYSPQGGVEVEENKTIQTHLISVNTDVAAVARAIDLPPEFLEHLIETATRSHWSFVEINPLVVQSGEVHVLDLAVLVDGAAEYLVKGAWTKDDVVQVFQHPAEVEIQKLQQTSPASFKLSVLNPDGQIFLLLSGGGGSIVVFDELTNPGPQSVIGNYGEYSGGPTREETYLYTRAVLGLVLNSKATKKALVIAGGIANFTNVHTTFEGIIDALRESAPALTNSGVGIFVRRGGPKEKAGLDLLRTFLEERGIAHRVTGSEAPLTTAADQALAFIRS